MQSKVLRVAGAVCAVALAAVACGSESESQNAGGAGSLTVGLLAPLSGPASAAFTGAQPGVEARLQAYREEGGKCSDTDIQVVTADDASSAQGALAGAQKLVQQDKAYAVLEVTPYFYGATQYATTAAASTPFIGGAFDSAPQWLDPENNLFGALPSVPDFSKVYSTMGDYWKGIGVTKIAAVAYDNEASKNGLKSTLASAEAAGVGAGYVNDTVPLGSTDVGPIVLGIVNSGADAVYLPINADTALAVVAGLAQAGFEPKSIVSATGYGADILASAPAVQAGQGVDFQTSFTPMEMDTPATKKMSDALKQYAGSASGLPSFSQAQGWFAADLLIHGLELAGCDAGAADFISTLRSDNTWDGGGMYPVAADFSKPVSDKQCQFLSRLEGDGFVTETNAAPTCGVDIS